MYSQAQRLSEAGQQWIDRRCDTNASCHPNQTHVFSISLGHTYKHQQAAQEKELLIPLIP